MIKNSLKKFDLIINGYKIREDFMTKSKCIAMLLAGGRGTRLQKLTQYLAKPAVPFGGKYRIIDFTLSNCRNSGICNVGVLTQYHPHLLHNYIGDGKHWDLDRQDEGLTILPPYQCENGERWYEGTAHAVYQNLHYIEQHNPEHVLVISGDHIYKMDYTEMLQQHIETSAEATISVMNVPWSEAGRFGIMNVDDETNQIKEFEEKPLQPKSNLASMGIYIFNWKSLKQLLIEEEKNPYSSKDFGKDIIPAMLRQNKKLFTYTFQGYWRDVGTIESYWEANMDLLTKETNIILNKSDWKIYTGNQQQPPVYLDYGAQVKQSLLNEGCEIFGNVDHSVLFNGVKVGKGSVIKDSVILPNAEIGDHVKIERAIIGNNAIITDGAVIGSNLSDITLVGENETVNMTSEYQHLISKVI